MISIAGIDQERWGILKSVLSIVMHSDTAKDVLAQVIDGLPTKATYELTITHRFDLLSRSKPSQDTRDLSQQFCYSLETLDNLRLNPKVAQLYQDSQLFSSTFSMHLLELVAMAVHDMAGNLYAAFHPQGEPCSAEAATQPFQPKDLISLSTWYYATPDRYPRGFLDVVGYWAETHIFGGVVVFDRGSEEGARRCHGAYIHPPRPDLQLFQLSESQLEQFCRLGSQDERDGRQITVPFVCKPEARKIDHYLAFRDLNIYRDRYERRIDPTPRWGPCVVRLEDHPELREFNRLAKEGFGPK
ncbi:hypothetical protein FQN51_008371 [Onygenales sp. PD_10]|nr:hypothetical protein FQN51_008371 [Onygenales sp. PD_10]